MTLFEDREIVHDPKVIIRKDNPSKDDFSFSIKQLEGTFYKVIPSTAKEVFFLQSLLKNVFIYAPAEGDGLIITLNLF
tara:strand:+ start:559 stop:792 length:234 start_codon:yes stop_codon:yes gene_type:complete